MALAPPAKNGYEAKKGVVQIASYDYLAFITVEQYFDRCKKYKEMTPMKQELIRRMNDLKTKELVCEAQYAAEIREAMHKTFSLRNYDIFKKSLSVRNAFHIYPGLMLFSELKREFQRVTKKDVDAFQRHLNCVLKEYAKEQIRQECYMCSNKYCTQAWEIIRGDNCTAARKTASRIMIYACAQSQRKWSDVIYKVYEVPPPGGWVITNRPHPTVVVNSSPFNAKCAEVWCEDTRVLQQIDFFEAVLSCYFLYYIFNIDYPSVDAETFQPFDNVMNLMGERSDVQDCDMQK